MSLTVTDLAVTKLKEYLSQNKIDSALRVAIMQGGWSGPSLGLALDEPKENDKVYDESELTFLVEDSLLETCGTINVEYIEAGPRSGFGISSEKPIGGGGGCSSGDCGSGSCGWPDFPTQRSLIIRRVYSVSPPFFIYTSHFSTVKNLTPPFLGLIF